MNNKYTCIPIYIKDNISYFKNDDESILTFTSKRHPELQRLEINKQSIYILDLCNGNNSILDIINKISNKFPSVEINRIEEDLYNILFKFWRLKIVIWKEKNPFEDLYNFKGDFLEAKILDEDEAVLYMKNFNELKFTPIVNKEFLRDDVNIRQRVYFGFEQYCLIKKGEESMLFSISFKNIKSKSCYINFYSHFNDYNDELKEVINWAITQYENFAKINLFRLDTFISNELYCENEYYKLLSFINKLGFKKIGEIKDYVSIEDKYFNIEILSLNLNNGGGLKNARI